MDRCFERRYSIVGASVLVASVPCLGRTTALRQAVWEWASGKIWKKHELVIFLNLRQYQDITIDSNATDELAFLTQCVCCVASSEGAPTVSREVIVKYISESRSKILFVFDGFEESAAKTQAMITRVLEQQSEATIEARIKSAAQAAAARELPHGEKQIFWDARFRILVTCSIGHPETDRLARLVDCAFRQLPLGKKRTMC